MRETKGKGSSNENLTDMGAVVRQGTFSHEALTLTVPSLRAKQTLMDRNLFVLAILPLALCACATRGDMEADRVAQEDAFKSQDDAACRAADKKAGTPAYDACRQDLATRRAQKAEIDYQKARDFDRVLGGLDNL